MSRRNTVAFVLLLTVSTWPESAASAVELELTLSISGQAAADRLGHSVAAAGDLNGDGFPDFLAGANLDDDAGPESGSVLVYFGGSGLDAVADLILMGEAAGDEFGFSVAGAGDVNDDGHPDVIVGAFLNDAAGAEAGRAYVFHGGPGMDAVADLVFTGEAAGDKFGVSVTGAGDVNGDGHDDVMVGAYRSAAGGSRCGRVYVFHGGPGADAVPDMVLTGEAAGDLFGRSVAGPGDMNGDGHADLLVGAYFHDLAGADAGSVYLYFGGPAADAIPDLKLTGEAAGDLFGYSVAATGDVNLDGHPDFVVGAPRNDGGGFDAGRAFLFYGGPFLDAVADLVLTGTVVGEELGFAVSGAGDVNADGASDVLVGTYRHQGKAYVFPGGTTPGTEPLVVLQHLPGGMFGSALCGAGDVDGDGNDDLLVGDPFFPSDSRGRVDLYSGVDLVDLVLLGEASNDEFGHSVSNAGDFNGDGIGDLIVGAAQYSAAGVNTGRAYIHLGSTVPDAAVDLVLTGEAADDYFGSSVSGSGDLNGDGYDDVIVGAYGNDAGGTDAGRAYIHHGGPGVDAVADLVLTGFPGEVLGYAVAHAGDVNGDGHDDFLVGAHGNAADGPYVGRAYLFHGGPLADAAPDLVLNGQAPYTYFGVSLSGGGDFNGDGYSDLVIGTYPYTGGALGHAYVYFGGASADTVPDLILVGESANDGFGFPVSLVGDVNQDGYDDILVGAPEFSYNDGRAYLYFGSASPDSVADRIYAAGYDDEFGSSVGAGDANGDGYSDLLIGAPAHYPGGRAVLYLGSADPDTVADATLYGQESLDRFGGAVSVGPDLNGDGLDDLVSGAAGDDSAGANAGAAHVYLGRSNLVNHAKPSPFPSFQEPFTSSETMRAADAENTWEADQQLEGGILTAAYADPDDLLWWGGFGGTMLDRAVYALTVYGGNLVAGGEFSNAGGVPGTEYVGLWDGSSWNAMPGGDAAGVGTRCLAVFNGMLYMGSTSAGAYPKIHQWNGTSWEPLGAGLRGEIRDLAEYQDHVVACGSFSLSGSLPVPGVARWDGVSWDPHGAGLAGSGRAVTEYDGFLYAAGSFTGSGGLVIHGIAEWDETSWNDVGGGVSEGSVLSLFVYQAELYAGGSFAAAGGVPGTEYLARWSGEAWAPVGTGPGFPVTDGVEFGGELVAGGWYAVGNTTSAAVWDGVQWTSLETGPDVYIRSMTVYDGRVVMGCEQDVGSIGNTEVHRLFAWDGSEWSGEMDSVGDGVSVFAGDMLPFEGSLIMAASGWAGGHQLVGLGRWDGSWHEFGSMNPSVNSLVEMAGELIVGGNGGVVRRWDGDSWAAVGGPIPDSPDVGNLLVLNGFLYARVSDGVFRLDGDTWTRLGPALPLLSAQAIWSYDGDVVLGGEFETIGSTTVNGVARWDGTAWVPMGTGMTLDDFWEPATVRGFTTFEGDLIATGWFDNADGKPAKGVARWDGTTWWPLGEGILGNGVDVTVFEGHLVACGFFWGEPFNNIGYWNGVEWRPFGSGMNGWVQHLAVYDGSLYASGSFESAGGKSSIHIARWTSNTVSVPDFPKNTMRAPYPNPGRGPVHIPFLVPPSKGMGRRVQVEVFDARGRILRRLHEGECPPGEHVVTWDGKTARGTVVRGICWARVTLDGVADGTIQLVRRP